MSSPYAFIVSASVGYVPELCALLNSLDYIECPYDVHVIGYELPRDFVDQFGKLNYKVIYHDVPEQEAREFGGPSEILCRKRYWYAAEWGKQYKSVCVLDSDMFFVRSVTQHFEIAEQCKFIVGVSLEQKRYYARENPHHTLHGQQILPEPRWNDKDFCCAPLWFDANTYGDLFKRSWTIFTEGYPNDNFKAPDMEAINIMALKENVTDKVFMLTNVTMVGTNEKHLKPYTRVTVQSDGKIWTESGEAVYIVHGPYYIENWRRQQLANRQHCCATYLGGCENAMNMARGAMELLHQWYLRMLDHKIKIEKKPYRPNGEPGDRSVPEVTTTQSPPPPPAEEPPPVKKEESVTMEDFLAERIARTIVMEGYMGYEQTVEIVRKAVKEWHDTNK